MDLISAYKVGNGNQNVQFSYHGDSSTNTIQWSLTLNEDGTCSGDEPTPTPTPTPPSDCTKSIDVGDGLQSTISMYYDSASDLVNFSAAVAPNSYVAVGFGTSMFDTDMIYWLQNPDTDEWAEVYATGESKP